ncbi:hypothetical protein FHW20_004477 [Ochrobactrum intermedium]|uniref:Type IV conjugative transfer protein TrbJ/K C-terminal domain-containing protein n=1 Tax=Brucella intermedia TaxID=94625 RepID=A0ABR6AVK6_9HYPH|nr:hypothetical protein [Brucella intermedia]
MSPRLIVFLILAGIAALSAGVVTFVVQPRPAPVSGSGAAATRPASETERREHRAAAIRTATSVAARR